MTQFVTSADGTRIAYDSEGTGPVVILIAGAFQFRAFDPTTVEMAAKLASQGLTVVNYDRRGRGESADARSYGLERDIEDIAALIDAHGGRAGLYGSSSGGAIALAAAAAGLPVTRLALWEVPLGDELGSGGAEFLGGLRERIAAGDGDATIEYFMKDMPPQWLEGAKQSPGWPIMTALAPSLEADSEALAWTQSEPRAQLWASVTQPTLVLLGEDTLPLMPPAAESILASLADARLVTIPAAMHEWAIDDLVPVLAEFFSD
ncbi:MAG: alpha/Beta hydrolase fold [Rhodoglobus sp.]|nr:alpha/Beta hydrolase fold [Rhodoglobus sp.]